jgi:hypothetical protein
LKTERSPIRNSAAQLQHFSRERADDQARRIPWRRLFEARNQYIDWQEFYLWVRSILEVEDRIPDWMVEILDNRCPGFLESIGDLTPKAAKDRPLPLRLEDWIDDHIFGFAREEGWFSAITFYAIREPRYQRAEVCWSESVERWKKGKTLQYPSLEEWKDVAAQCDDTANLLPDVRKARASTKLVAPVRLAEAVSRYIDWEAFAYWVRPAMELSEQLPAEVVRELEQRSPGFLERYCKTQKSEPSGVHPWPQLMSWIGDHFFAQAKAEGWFDAILIAAQNHPRAIRTMEYADHCDEIWGPQLPEPYPSFEDWRSNADSYVELPHVLPKAFGS